MNAATLMIWTKAKAKERERAWWQCSNLVIWSKREKVVRWYDQAQAQEKERESAVTAVLVKTKTFQSSSGALYLPRQTNKPFWSSTVCNFIHILWAEMTFGNIWSVSTSPEVLVLFVDMNQPASLCQYFNTTNVATVHLVILESQKWMWNPPFANVSTLQLPMFHCVQTLWMWILQKAFPLLWLAKFKKQIEIEIQLWKLESAHLCDLPSLE